MHRIAGIFFWRACLSDGPEIAELDDGTRSRSRDSRRRLYIDTVEYGRSYSRLNWTSSGRGPQRVINSEPWEALQRG